MGEISDALRRARGGSVGPPERRAVAEGAPAREGFPEPVAPRPEIPEPDVDAADSAFADDTDARRLSLGRDREGEWQARVVVVDEGSPATESFRQLALRTRAELERRSLRSVAITGPLRGEGKTTIACGLALALASVSRGRKVALVDLDLRKPSVAAQLRIHLEIGVERVLEEVRALREVCLSIEKPAVDVFPAASPHDSAHELLVQPGFTSLVHELERRYDTVIFDTPPVLLVPDTQLILDQVRAYLAVARSGETRERALQSMLELLPADRFLGTVLNDGPPLTRAGRYQYYGGELSSSAPEE